MSIRHLIACLLVLISLSLAIPYGASAHMGDAAEVTAVVNNQPLLSISQQPLLQTQWWRTGTGILALSLVGSVLIVAGAWFMAGQSLSWWQYGIIGAAAYTGIGHVMIGLTYEGEFLLLLDGLGFLAFLVALYVPISLFDGFRPWLRWVLLFYTLVGLIAYIIIHIQLQHFGELALTIKAAELLLVGLLIGRLRGMGEPSTA